MCRVFPLGTPGKLPGGTLRAGPVTPA